MSFLEEIKRRKVFQVAAVYAVVAWLIIQVIDLVQPRLGLDDKLPTVVIVLLAVGFPLALVFAWALEITPSGIVRTRPRDVEDASRRAADEAAPVGPATKQDVSSNSVAVLPFDNLSPNSEDE